MVNYGCTYNQDCSRAITIHETAQFWELAGGNPAYTVKMVAVAMAESCLDPYATSQSCAVGIWQIVAGNVISGRPSVQELFSPLMSAQWAVRLSNAGDNVAAWDVAYAAGEALERLPYLHDLQPGSTAYMLLAVVGNTLGTTGGSGFTEPGVSLATDIEAAPQRQAPPDIPSVAAQPVVNPPPDMVRLTYPGPPAIYNDSTSGWESVTRYFTNDIPYYTGYDQYLVDILHRLPGNAG